MTLRGLVISLVSVIAMGIGLSPSATMAAPEQGAAAQGVQRSGQGGHGPKRPDLADARLAGGRHGHPPGDDVPPPKGIYQGSYEETSDCPVEGCAYGPGLFVAPTPLYKQQDTRGPVVATIPVGECALKTGRDAVLSVPVRGVLLKTFGRFKAGDVIYFTNVEGEGFSTFWYRGEYFTEFADDLAVRWDEAPKDPRAGYWVEVRRADGRVGWALDPDISDRDCSLPRR